MNCANCGLPIEKIVDPWGGEHGWHHPTIEREANIDGADVRIHATFCPDDLGEAAPEIPLDLVDALILLGNVADHLSEGFMEWESTVRHAAKMTLFECYIAVAKETHEVRS